MKLTDIIAKALETETAAIEKECFKFQVKTDSHSITWKVQISKSGIVQRMSLSFFIDADNWEIKRGYKRSTQEMKYYTTYSGYVGIDSPTFIDDIKFQLEQFKNNL